MFAKRIGFDMGTDSIKVCADFSDSVRRIPSVAAVDTADGRLLGYGESELAGRTPSSFRLVRFMRDGAVHDFALAGEVVGDITDRLLGQRVLRPVLVSCVCVGSTELERKTLLDILQSAGAARAYLIYAPVASAIGVYGVAAGPEGRAVLDVGAGAADCAVISMNGIASRRAVPVAGNAMTRAIMEYLETSRDVFIGESEAERLKKELSSAIPREAELAFVSGGKKLNGEAVNFELTSTEVYRTLRGCFAEIGKLVVAVLDDTPPELVSDIRNNGILLTGGCAAIPGLDVYLSKTLGVPVTVPPEPALCAVNGIKKILPRLKELAQAGVLIGRD